MPDIRSFFGGKGSQGSTPSQEVKKKPVESGSLKRKRAKDARKVVDDSDEEENDDPPPAKRTPQKRAAPSKRAKQESPEGEATTTSDYFATNGKSKPVRSTPRKTSAPASKETTSDKASPVTRTPRSAKGNKTSTEPTAEVRTSGRKKGKPITYTNDGIDDDDDPFVDVAEDAGDDIFAADFKKGKRRQDDIYMEDEDEDLEDFKPGRQSSSNRGQKGPTRGTKKPAPKDENVDMRDVNAEDDFLEPDPKENLVADRQLNGRKTKEAAKRKKPDKDFDDEDDDDEAFEILARTSKRASKADSPSKKAAPKKPTPKKPRASAKDDVPESGEIAGILDTIPTVRPPSPPPADGEPRKFNYQNQAQRSAPPPAAGSKEIPVGQENCLAGLTFVFTGLLESLGREEGQELVKRYGGKITTAPSKKTSFVVLGTDAGPKKLQTIRDHGIKTIDEEGLFALIQKLPANGGDSKAALKHEEQKQKEQDKIKQMAAEMAEQERKMKGPKEVKGTTAGTPAGPRKATPDTRLWTVKYAPAALNQICGNKTQVERLQRWLREWPKSQRIQFKKAGPDGSFMYRAVIIHGPPGIGKTTAAHLAAKMEGYDIIESNASDTRSKKLVETGLRGILDNTSLLGYFAGDDKKVDSKKKKIVLIMDEVDGMSAGDRGGVGALAQVCKKTNIPMILICNDRKLPKMKPFDHVTYEMAFRRPTTQDIRSRIGTICYREGLKLPPQVIDGLIEGSHADIRQIINMISQVKLDQEAMDFDQGKSMSKAWEKHVILKPWDIVNKLLSSGMFAPTSNKTLNDKIELYFNDHEFSYLMVQENYLKPRPSIANSYSGREHKLKTLELVDKAAQSISDGDLVDRMIHGSQQQWSLMPAHAIFSTVLPASYIYGSLGGATSFTSWLGNNSKQGKLFRYVKEIQGHMRLRASGDHHEIRQQYLPNLWYQLAKKLETEGKDAVPDVIELMDSYYLTKEDFDAIVELGVGPMDMEKSLKIDTQTKSTFTRLYNQASHPLPFMKASNIVAPQKLSKVKPDLEEALDESDEGEDPAAAANEVKEEDEDAAADLSKDKYVKQPKKKAAGKKAPAKKAAGKEKGADDDDDDDDLDGDEEDDIKPKKGRGGKGKAAGAKRKSKG
ncbi:MAG: hypothetical protein M1817_002771 [Caeruleum heppii]|nr:MAG: hypothetical protein M1817_002771 [Caeruleum heppii]